MVDILGPSRGFGGLVRENSTIATCPRARVKLEELFGFWISQNETISFINGLLAGAPSEFTPATPPSSPLLAAPASPAGANTNQVSHGLIPPSAGLVSPLHISGSALTEAASDAFPHGARQAGTMDTAPWATKAKTLSVASPSRQPRFPKSPGRPQTLLSPRPDSYPLIQILSPRTTDQLILGPDFTFPAFSNPWYPDPNLEQERFTELFFLSPNGTLSIDPFLTVCKEVCGFPSFFATPFLERVGGYGSTCVSLNQFIPFWDAFLKGRDPHERLFNMIRSPDHPYIEPRDFLPFLSELLEYHPSLEFLKATPEFQKSYVETVIARIFYDANFKRNKRLSLEEVRRSHIMEMFTVVDEETDINEVKLYFSYEHFYVIYCKFWELDQDRDRLLGPIDLLRYGHYALLSIAIDRVFELYCPDGKMAFDQFVYFILSEEDKTTPQSLQYWFQVVDLDSDGVISPSEMEAFYREQLSRLECIPHEGITFSDVLCQLHDMVAPRKKNHFTMLDIKRCRMGGNIFNVLLNINKFLFFEQADPFIGHEERMALGMSDWSRFADAEYVRLASEEDDAMDEDTLSAIAGPDYRFDSFPQFDATSHHIFQEALL
eukprot:c5005_g1_i1.p1 GENE.c5005_g1_i1~~c5005_g1_i1.p1  ORF type:complete len:604 (+),score=147.62 c5005_g1_i1:367-2178(+)